MGWEKRKRKKKTCTKYQVKHKYYMNCGLIMVFGLCVFSFFVLSSGGWAKINVKLDWMDENAVRVLHVMLVHTSVNWFSISCFFFNCIIVHTRSTAAVLCSLVHMILTYLEASVRANFRRSWLFPRGPTGFERIWNIPEAESCWQQLSNEPTFTTWSAVWSSPWRVDDHRSFFFSFFSSGGWAKKIQ